MNGARVLALLLLLPGCGSCGRTTDRDAGPPPLVPAELPPVPRPWTFAPVREASGFALPPGCTERGPMSRADVAATTRFIAEPRTMGTLAVAEIAGQPARLTAAGAMKLEPAGASHDASPIPWFAALGVPRLARAGDAGWIGAFARPGKSGSRVAVWRALGAPPTAEEVGEGDGFEPVDIGCAGTRCALLTSRMMRVAAPGAEIRVGDAASPASSWKRVEIAPARPDSDAQPVSFAAIDPHTVAVLSEGEDVVFWDADETPPREVARLPAPHGILDALAAPTPLALVYGTEIGDDGCAKGGGKVRFERGGAPGALVVTPGAPLMASLRRLSRGALATWIAPLGCGASRRVVFSVVLGADGAPTSEVMAVADGTSYAVATAGDEVDLWIQRDAAVTWLRARCAPP